MDMNLLKYLAFVKTAETGSFTRASLLLHYSQSGISRMVSDLEKEWGITLLRRSRTGVKPTPDGARLLPYARNLCAEYQKLQSMAGELQGLQFGLIRIGTFSSVATHWLPNITRAFQKDYPGVDYEFLLGDYIEIENWIAEGRVDCGFLRLPTRPAFHAVPLAQDHLMAILPEGHPLAALDTVPLAGLCEDPFLLLARGANTQVADLFDRHKLRPRIRFTTWDDYAIMSMVEGGLGVSILPELILKRVPYRIVARPLDVPALRTIGVAVRDEATTPLATRRFLDYLHYRDAE